MRLFRYAALGDSSAVGVGAESDGGYPERLARRLKAAGVPVGILNLGRSGATVAQLGGALERAARAAPDLVTLGIGTNDAWRMTSAEAFARNLARIADDLQRTGASVVASNLPDLGLAPAARLAQAWVGVTPAQITARIGELNERIAALASRPRFVVVDLFATSRRELPAHPEYFSPDGFHPSPAGYDYWADALWPAVSRAAADWMRKGEGPQPAR